MKGRWKKYEKYGTRSIRKAKVIGSETGNGHRTITEYPLQFGRYKFTQFI